MYLCTYILIDEKKISFFDVNFYLVVLVSNVFHKGLFVKIMIIDRLMYATSPVVPLYMQIQNGNTGEHLYITQ